MLKKTDNLFVKYIEKLLFRGYIKMFGKCFIYALLESVQNPDQ